MGKTISEAAERLLGEIDAWCVHTGQTPGRLGQMALNHGGFAPMVRVRGTVREETANRVRAFMAAFPTKFPADLIDQLLRDARAGSPWTPERHDGLMRKLSLVNFVKNETQAIAAAPAGKPKISAAVIRAAKLDGRDLAAFVTALIDMGLECWRDDRRENGEATA